MRIGLLSSWPWDLARGSGTARFLLDLERALSREGAGVTRIDADLDPADYAAFVEGRIAWNRDLALDPRLRGLDVLFALDLDGFELPPPPAGPPKVVCPQAVFADLAGTEPEPYRGLLLRQAEAERRNVRSAAALITPSRYAAEGIVRAYRADPSKVRVIPHGFDVEEWQTMVESDGRLRHPRRARRSSGPCGGHRQGPLRDPAPRGAAGSGVAAGSKVRLARDG
ncbi:MAG: glycosyltransferase family 4 protein [Candidatus Eisenbacteria bacterium]|nr:glycosyltransferase family 4 protein [Candidatus Eisenbacteria bacterium]